MCMEGLQAKLFYLILYLVGAILTYLESSESNMQLLTKKPTDLILYIKKQWQFPKCISCLYWKKILIALTRTSTSMQYAV